MAALNDELLSHHIATIKRGAGLGNQVEPYLADMKAIIRKQVAGFDSEKRTAKRLEKLIETLANKLAFPAGQWRKELEKELKDFALYEAKYQTETISGWVNVEMTQPTLTQVWAATQFQPLALGDTPIDFTKLLDDWGVDEVNRLTMAVKSGFVRGQTINQIIKEVVGASGLSDISLRNAKTIAQTAMMHVATEARMQTMQENDDVVIGYEWVSTLDSRTSNICRYRDGMVFLFTDKFQPKPPAHHNCRSSVAPKLSPEFDIFDEGATRASKGADGGKQVSADQSYYGWLKSQPAGFQDEVLGPTRGQIFRNSGLSAEEFRRATVDDLGRPLTLEQMAARDKRVAEYMRNQS